MKRQFVTILILVFAGLTQGYAQQGILKGKITDKKTGEELVGAAIVVEGTTTGTITNFMGDYEMPPLDAGTYTFRCQYISYEPQIQTGIIIIADGETILNFEMGESELDLEEVRIVAKANRSSENFLMMEQKNAAIAIENIGAEQLSTQGVSDAATAVTKLSGIVKQEGSQSLNVRGLGDRYNTTTLNGLPLPSNNAELKNIDLKLFDTDVISHINIEKTFTPTLYGDFGGANVNIVSKKLVGNPFLRVSIKGSQNTNLFDLDKFYLQDGPNASGIYNTDVPNIEAIQSRTAYGFENSWNPVEKTIYPSIGMGISGGKSFEVNETSKLNAFFNLSFDNERNYSERIERVVSASGLPLDDLKGEEYQYETQTTGMLNLNYSRPNSELFFNSMMLNSSAQTFTSMIGSIRDVNDVNSGMKRRGNFERNFVMVNQFLGEHKISDQTALNWGLAYNYIKNTVPDRIQNTYMFYYPETNIGELDPETTGRNFRYFHSFNDHEIAANIAFDKTFGEPLNENSEYRGKLTFGYNGRYKTRNFSSHQFNHQILVDDNNQNIRVDVNNIDDYINEENYLNGSYNIIIAQADGQPGFSYDGTVMINGGFGMVEYNVSSRLMLLAGVRVENVSQKINYLSNQNPSGREESTDFNEWKILPGLSLKYMLNEKQNLRFSTSKTYTLPQLQEMPFLVFEGITDAVYGNPYLYPSTIYNGDLKWEFFPKTGEKFTASVFGKYIEDPINKFAIYGRFNEFTNANTGDWAYVYGIELDGKKNLYSLVTESCSRKLFVAANLTLMDTKQELNADKIRKETKNHFGTKFNKEEDVLQGAAPLIVNATLGYKYGWDNNAKSVSSALVYNYISDRLYAIGHSSLGNQIDQAMNTVDIVLKTKFNKLGVDFAAKNILNENIDRIQENTKKDELVRSYKRGVTLTLTLSYKF